jgi:hypothetical protein
VSKNEWRDLAPEGRPPSEKNDAVLAYDPASQKVLALFLRSEGKDESATHRLETWTLDVGEKAWMKMNPPHEPDSAGSRARVLLSAPEENVIFLENCTSRPREQQIWSLRMAPATAPQETKKPLPRPVPAAIEDVVVSVRGAKEVEISWRPGKGFDALQNRYLIERAPVEVYTEDELKRLKSRTPPLAEPSVGALRKVGAFETLTPDPVQGVSFFDRDVDLSLPVPAAGPAVYDRPRSKEEVDPDGKTYRFAVYAYRVRAISPAGVRGGPSAAIFTIPSAPSWVYCKEDGTTARLKWAPNPEKGIRGYRVYRMDGRFDKEPVKRLSEEPTLETGASDPQADRKTRRYYVVGVDALGQEGFPSMPVWYEREWKAYYKPFTGEWHQ